MGKLNDLANKGKSSKLIKELNGKPVRFLMENDKIFRLIDPKTGKNLKVLMDDKYSFKLVTYSGKKDTTISDLGKKFSSKTRKLVNIKLKDGTNIKFTTDGNNKKNKVEVVKGKANIENYGKSKFERFFTEKSFNLLEVMISLILAVIAIILLFGILKDDKKPSDNNSLNGYESIKDSSLTEFIDLYTSITNNYINDVDSSEMLDVVTEAMLKYLGDNYSGYLDPSEARSLMDKLNGKYQGLGFEITTDENGDSKVTYIFENSNAFKSGIKVGDKILSVAGIDVTEKNSSDISLLIKDKLSGLLKVEVERDGKKLEFDIEKGDVIINAVTTEMFGNVGYLKIDAFSNMAFDQVKNALNDLESKGMKSLVVDVRYNNGGYLDSAYKIADLFIEKGKNIYQLKTNKETTVYQAVTADKKNYKVAVLINGTSASASEVFALAMKNSYGATLLGSRSYGKGTVQETTQLSTGSLVKYTIANWLGPNGENINNKGINPDKFVDMGAAYIKDQTYENDGQLQEAIKVVSE